MTGTHLKDKAKELFEQNSNWIGVGVGIKEVAGASTGQHAVTLYVEKKKPLEEVDEADRFPSSVTVDGVDYPTDVVEEPNPVLEGPTDYCYTGAEASNFDQRGVMPLSANNSVRRPLIGGIKMGTLPPTGYGGAYVGSGTLGGLVVDNTDNTICALTNMHVVYPTYFSSEKVSTEAAAGTVKGGTKFATDTGYSTYFSYLCAGAIYREDNEDTIYPSGNNGGVELTEEIGNYPFYQHTDSTFEVVMATYKVGSVKRTSLITSEVSQVATVRMDAALLTIEPANCKSAQDGSSVNYQQIVAGAAPDGTYEGTIDGVDYGMEFATTEEIEKLTNTQFYTDENGLVPEAQDGTRGPLVFRSGARQGPVGSPGTLASYPVGQADWCPLGMLSAYDLNYMTRIRYNTNVGLCRIYDCIKYRGTVKTSAGGDSGSFLCARIPISVAGGDPWDGTVTYSEWKIIGHHFAGSSGVYSIAARIDNMATDLDIRAYRGAGTLEFATLANKQTRITTGYSSDLTMTYNGKKYWQAGKTIAPAEDV